MIWKKYYSVTVLLLLLAGFSPSLQAQEGDEEKAALLVLDFQAKEGVSKALAETVTGFIRSNMVRINLFHVVERESMESILKEQAFQETGLTQRAAVEVGRLLAAEKIFTGTVGLLNDGYAISGNIIDAEEGKIEFSASETAEKEGHLQIAVENLCRRLAGRILGIPEDEIVLREPPRWPYFWRSTLIPGWGQYYAGSFWRGVAYLSVGSALTMNYFMTVSRFKTAEAAYQNTIAVPFVAIGTETLLYNEYALGESRSAYRSAQSAQNNASYAVMGFWLWNMADAYFFRGGSPDKFLSNTGETDFFAWPDAQGGVGFAAIIRY